MFLCVQSFPARLVSQWVERFLTQSTCSDMTGLLLVMSMPHVSAKSDQPGWGCKWKLFPTGACGTAGLQEAANKCKEMRLSRVCMISWCDIVFFACRETRDVPSGSAGSGQIWHFFTDWDWQFWRWIQAFVLFLVFFCFGFLRWRTICGRMQMHVTLLWQTCG